MGVTEHDGRARFGPYEIVRRLGSGGMGSVFEAEDTRLGRRVALKLLHPHVERRKGAADRFLREGRAAARIRHPNVIQVFGLGVEGDTPYLAMELALGDDLSQVIARKKRLSVEEALDIVLPVVAAMAAAHDAGVIHRDLKPSNVCITRGPGAQPWPKVVDFGVSRVVATEGASDSTGTDTVVGTAAYMAPEQARSASNASCRSDQYSLAVLLYQCVTGALPFSGRSVYEVVESVMTAPLIPPSARAPFIPPALDVAVLRAMSRVPSQRFPSIRAFGGALLALASERTRLGLAAELCDPEGPEPRETNLAVARDVRPTPADTGTLVGETTMSPSDWSTRRERTARNRTVSLCVAGAALLVGGVLVIRSRGESDGGSEATAKQPMSLIAGPPPSVAARAKNEEVFASTVATATSDAPEVPRRPVAPAQPPRRAVHTPSEPDAGTPSAGPRGAVPPIVFGDNDAPILP